MTLRVRIGGLKINCIGFGMSFTEDKSCIRNHNAAENLATLRKWALAFLTRVKNNPHQSIKSIIRKNAISFEFLINSILKIFHA